MKYSLFTQPMHPLGKDYRQLLEENRQAIILADELGFTTAFVGEHFTELTEPITSVLTFLASVIGETSKINLGSGTINILVRHPLLVAAHVAMFDQLSGGRYVMGIGPGGGSTTDAEAFDLVDKDRTGMFVECIDQVLALWSQEPPFDIRGKFWSISTKKNYIAELGAGCVIKPLQKPHPPIVATVAAPYSNGISAAAARGWSALSADWVHANWIATHWPKYVEGCQSAGLKADTANWSVARSIFVGEDSRTVDKYARSQDGPYAWRFASLKARLDAQGPGRLTLLKGSKEMPEEDVTMDYILRNFLICGTVNEVAEQIMELREVIGDFGTLTYYGYDWANPSLAKRSMELFANEVMPLVNKLIAQEARAGALVA